MDAKFQFHYTFSGDVPEDLKKSIPKMQGGMTIWRRESPHSICMDKFYNKLIVGSRAVIIEKKKGELKCSECTENELTTIQQDAKKSISNHVQSSYLSRKPKYRYIISHEALNDTTKYMYVIYNGEI